MAQMTEATVDIPPPGMAATDGGSPVVMPVTPLPSAPHVFIDADTTVFATGRPGTVDIALMRQGVAITAQIGVVEQGPNGTPQVRATGVEATQQITQVATLRIPMGAAYDLSLNILRAAWTSPEFSDRVISDLARNGIAA